MKKIYLIILCIFSSTYLFGQGLVFEDYSINYYTQKAQMIDYLDSMDILQPDSIFYHEGSEFNRFKQWEAFWEERLSPHGDFSVYFDNLQQGYDDIGQRSSAYDVEWHEIGPLDKPTGTMPANYGQSAGIGPIEFVRFYKDDPDYMICGSTNGGVFFSDDGGNNWVNAGTDHWSGVSAVSWAEFKTDDPEIIYASCTTPADNQPGTIQTFGGVFRVQKNGTINPNSTWQRIADYNSLGVSTNCLIRKLLTDPVDSDILYIVTSEGLFKSSNVNATTPTWTEILTDNIFDLEMNPGNHSILYVSFKSPSSNSNIVKYSTTGGIFWNTLSNLPSYSVSNISHISLEVSDAFPNNIYIYFYGTTSANKDLYRYNYSSNTYSQINSNQIDDGNICCFGHGTAFGISQYGTNEIILIAHNDRYRKYINNTLTTYTSSSSNKYEYHVDIEGFTFKPNDSTEVWMASHGGTHKSVNRGTNWSPKMSGLGVAMVLHLADSYERPEDVLIGTYHDGCILSEGTYSDGWTPPWKFVYGGDGQKVLIDNKEPDYMYASSAGWGSDWTRSGDGSNFFGISFYSPPGWGAYAILNKEETNIIYGLKDGKIIRDLNWGNGVGSFISDLAARAGVSPSCSVVKNIYAFEKNKNLLIAKFGNCTTWDLYYTLNATSTSIDPIYDWHKINLGNGARSIYDVEIDPTNSNNLYVVLEPDWSGGSMKIVNKIENFTATTPTVIDLTSNFPVTAFQERDCMVIEKGSDGGIYVATDLGAIFYTNNKLLASSPNDAWIQFGSNYPHLHTNGLEINYKANKIRAVPYGRGVWEADLYCPQSGSLSLSGNVTQSKFVERDGAITSTETFNSGLAVKYRSTSSIELLPGFISTGTTNSSFEAFIHGCSAPGNSFRHYQINSNSNNETAKPDNKTEVKFIRIIPNPNNGNFNVLIMTENTLLKQVKLYDILGKIVWENNNLSGNSFEVNISSYPNGVYYLQAVDELGNVYREKLLKQ